MSVLVAGIHTGIGKTVCSALLCEALGYNYWKPVQAGDLDRSDTSFVRAHVSDPSCRVYPEAVRLRTAMSPHRAAELDGVTIPRSLALPAAEDTVVETAGGVMSPLGEGLTNIDLAAQWRLPVALVCRDYLGSINHTLLTVEALQRRQITIWGLIFNGAAEPSSRSFILSHTRAPLLFTVPQMDPLNRDALTQYARTLSLSPSHE